MTEATPRKRILIISFSTIASDARVLKQITRLGQDYEIDTLGYGPAPRGVAKHFAIEDRHAIWRYPRLAVMVRAFRWAYWHNPAIMAAQELVRGGAWDLILANDVDAVGLALSIDSMHGVHADLHEYAPRQKEDMLRWRFFVAPFVRWLCRGFVARADSVSTVGQGIADEYAARFGIVAQVVTNAAPYADLEPTAVEEPLRLVHSGAALRDRNIVALVDAVEQTSSDVSLALYLTPNDPGFLGEIRARAAASARVTLHDPVPYEDLSVTLNGYDVGLHLLPPTNFNNRWALPNKFFDYVQARLGVVIGPSPEMARTLEAHAFGAVADGFSTEDLTRVLDGLSIADVSEWKAAADAAASELSSQEQVEIWAASVSQLMRGPG
ncbi:glycosyltransferase family 1 protein [Microbacterium murale]|uniref:D-inositol 3-phosphate glycosyltransferase n=1 Tax=Microbacterium murale TaxID=1081040 RepID=A0ABU0PCH1_9MICO|nr:glycosyltransferase family 1 protein [Microbacterium murale]MDQ0645036.1 hypothetical protein [Microbacterium murale]